MGDSEKLYFGSKKEVPKGMRRASMIEAKEHGQISYWGVMKVDNRVLNMDTKKHKITQKQMTAIRIKQVRMRGTIKRLTRELRGEKDEKKKKKLEKELAKATEDLKTANQDAIRMEKIMKGEPVDEPKPIPKRNIQKEMQAYLKSVVEVIDIDKKKNLSAREEVDELTKQMKKKPVFKGKSQKEMTEIVKKNTDIIKSEKDKGVATRAIVDELKKSFTKKELKEIEKLVKEIAPVVNKEPTGPYIDAVKIALSSYKSFSGPYDIIKNEIIPANFYREMNPNWSHKESEEWIMKKMKDANKSLSKNRQINIEDAIEEINYFYKKNGEQKETAPIITKTVTKGKKEPNPDTVKYKKAIEEMYKKLKKDDENNELPIDTDIYKKLPSWYSVKDAKMWLNDELEDYQDRYYSNTGIEDYEDYDAMEEAGVTPFELDIEGFKDDVNDIYKKMK